MDFLSLEIVLGTLIFLILIGLSLQLIDKMNWWGGVKKTIFVIWNIASAIFILLGTLVSLIFIMFTAMLFASGKD
ncbi:hypothetical protein [Staphylococcus saprophyticus]|jgi:hypothetical protein|uniref:hypothetical protein n=1 Tax=Staphylococcus saprophyticus TaxID=29385 RepID=UPI00164280A4|nr:hypothetical protein [Staphylococcus saprophyticus]MBC2921975.1 hypothetical protein [Staphylococcus saprophyticus]MBC2958502.1 hypothetical protein [Staphylococcus saprophyticus]MBC3010415.1 hypothetical protein [Staphylococcus saprophyticus]MBC3024294.1 hypothetical protein [Staphylococcus saprophyticus]MBC3031521.1 hypothetical protein [Staphylococcus saprophyticus]